MKVLLLHTVFLLYSFDKLKIYSKNLINTISKPDENKECLQECLKISKSNRCFCDKQCLKYDDCCDLFSLKCKNFFSQMINDIKDTKVIVNSCCTNNPNSDCFCDSKCVSFNDCCDDYLKCDTINVENKNTDGRSLAKRMSEAETDKKEEEILYINPKYNARIEINVNFSDK
jgi:hypothetical protein